MYWLTPDEDSYWSLLLKTPFEDSYWRLLLKTCRCRCAEISLGDKEWFFVVETLIEDFSVFLCLFFFILLYLVIIIFIFHIYIFIFYINIYRFIYTYVKKVVNILHLFPAFPSSSLLSPQWSSLSVLWPVWWGCMPIWGTSPCSTHLSPMILPPTAVACLSECRAVTMVVYPPTFATWLLFLKRLAVKALVWMRGFW